MNAGITLYQADGTVIAEAECLRFSLLRERYLPYATLTADFFTQHLNVEKLCRVRFSLDDRLLHDGIIRSYSVKTEQNHQVLHLVAHSYTEALMQNQLVPGLHTHVTLHSLMTTYNLPHVTYEDGIEEVNYIYVRDGAAMWDSLAAYNYKLNIGYPYVTVCNHLRMTPQTGGEPIVLPADKILAREIGGDTASTLSRIDMADIDGTYGTFTMNNPEAIGRDITRVKQILMDRSFLYDPYQALYFRLAVSNRRLRTKAVSYLGYGGEDIEDLVQCTGFLQDRVSRILLTGSGGVIRTTDTFYYDSFCNT